VIPKHIVLLGAMDPSSSFAEATRRAFDNLSLELHKSTEDDNCTEELEEFLKIMDNNVVDEEDFYQHLEFEHEDEDCAISTSARNYPTHATRITFDDDASNSSSTLPKQSFPIPTKSLRCSGNPSTVFPCESQGYSPSVCVCVCVCVCVPCRLAQLKLH